MLARVVPVALLLSSFLCSECFLAPTPRSQVSSAKAGVASRVSPMGRFAKVTNADMDDAEERAVQEELMRKYKGLFNEKGEPYAPWLIKQVDLAASAAAIRRRRERERNMKLEDVVPESALGALKYRIQGERDVELAWSTGEEKDNLGFVVLRKLLDTDGFEEIASFKSWAPLNSKGPQGGYYTYVDPDVEPGAYLYRVLDTDKKGKRQVLAQTVVEVITAAESTQSKIFAGVFIALMVGLFVGLSSLDPIQ